MNTTLNQLSMTANQQRILDLYTSDQYLYKAMCNLRFIELHPNTQKEIAQKAIKGGCVGVALGSGLGAAICSLSQKFFYAFSNPTRFIFDCAILGGVSGAAFGAQHQIVFIRQSPEFARWKVAAIKEAVYPLFMSTLLQDEVLENLVCHITLELIQDPVRTPEGCVYEREAIQSWLRNQTKNEKGETLDVWRQPLSEESLVEDYTYHKKVVTRMRELLQKEEIDPKIKQGLSAYIHALKYERDQLALHEIKALYGRLSERSIHLDQYNEEHKQIQERYSL